MNPFVYDIEIFRNMFCVTFITIECKNPFDVHDVQEKHQFVIHKDRNDHKALLKFIEQKDLKLIGFNNVAFDYPLLHLILVNPQWTSMKPEWVIKKLFDRAQELTSQAFGRGGKRIFPLIPQRDVYLIWHFDNPAKAASLKWIQGAMGWYNVQDMPFAFTDFIEKDDIPKVLSYNENDVLSTRCLYLDKKTQEKITIRHELSKKFGIQMHNYNDPKIGETIILNNIAIRRGVDLWELKQTRTERGSVALADCILPWIKFDTEPFQAILRKFNSMIIREGDTRNDKHKEEFKLIYDGLRYSFGLGGIHAAASNSTFHDVQSCDVEGYYPNMVISNGWHPEHLPEFIEVYRDDVVKERKKYPKKITINGVTTPHPINEGYKLAANGAFGKSNSEWSALKDLKFFMQITINGQLGLAMLCEQITERKAGKVIMANTDGIEVIVTNERLYKEACEEWMARTGLNFEFLKYKTLAIRDVNNYIAVKEDGTTKEKGDYEVDKEFHKDQSMKIVTTAVREYFKSGRSIREYIEENKDIKGFLMMKRAKTGHLETVDVVDGEIERQLLPHTNRYYISKDGVSMIKQTSKVSRVHKRFLVTNANLLLERPFEMYHVDKRFYINEATKLFEGTLRDTTGKNKTRAVAINQGKLF